MSARSTIAVLILNSSLLGACQEADIQSGPAEVLPTIEVTATYDPDSNQHLFQSSADTVQSGWTTFRFVNASPVLHFVFFDHLPGSRTSDDMKREVFPIFQESMDLINQGKPEEAGAPFARLPEWFADLTFRGGPGFTSPGLTNETTLYLEPGNYVLECYIKTADGVFHWNLGMFVDLHVTDEANGVTPPTDPTLKVSVTDSALVVDGELTEGTNLVQVDFNEKEVAPGTLGKDVHVARIDAETDLNQVLDWMDVFRVEGLVSTPEAQAPAVFLGGVHEMPQGNVAYFTLDIEPGQYLFVSEQSASQPIYQVLTVR